MRLGMIGRADSGGLGNLLWEFARHMQPDRVVVMDLGAAGRSATHLDRYEGLDVRVCHGTELDAESMDWLLSGCDVLYTAETAYAPTIWRAANERGVRTVLHAMPELFVDHHWPDELWLPTEWEVGRFANRSHKVVPVPVALDRFEGRVRSPVTTFVHVAAPAMRDRNGTDIVLAALGLVTQPCKVVFRGLDFQLDSPVGMVDVETDTESARDYWDIWPEGGDALLLPRRFAGLSLPMQEAMARGMPVISTDLAPQNTWPGVLGVPVMGSPQPVPMAGGNFLVHDVRPAALASAMDLLVSDAELATAASTAALEHAQGLSWDIWAPRYRSLLGLDQKVSSAT